MKRKDFIKLSTSSFLGAYLLPPVILNNDRAKKHSSQFHKMCNQLLQQWSDGMISVQIHKPNEPKHHGLLQCPVCEVDHGRCMDAVYPFLQVAHTTGENKYLEAGVSVFNWAQKNVSQKDGSWSNIRDPKSWRGTTVFGAIALAETLYFHGELLKKETQDKWTKRLAEAAEYIDQKFTIDFTNINYGVTAIYAFNLMGRVLANEFYLKRSQQLAQDVKVFFTENNHFLFGEIKPSAYKLSKKGLRGVDLGYNVEESLNSLVLYAVHEKDKELLDILETSMNTHLEFMLPDGGWDNSWGTRQFKWSYWGSRTTDGCQPAFSMMAHKNPAFGTAAIKSTELLKRCTHNNLLHGGLHYESAGLKPCIHHTFSHAKNLAVLLDNWDSLPVLNTDKPLPRNKIYGIKKFQDIDTILLSKGSWRATITAYDAIYKDGSARQATGGSLSLLYHTSLGLICAASMAKYKRVEKNNQRPNPGIEFALTPRIETFIKNNWYTNLFDRTASLESKEENQIVSQCILRNNKNEILTESASHFETKFSSVNDIFVIEVSTKESVKAATAFVLPIVSSSKESYSQQSPQEVSIKKSGGTLSIKCEHPIRIKKTEKKRIFNMVPGVEVIPLEIPFSESQPIKIEITDN